jgi:dynein heavy chain
LNNTRLQGCAPAGADNAYPELDSTAADVLVLRAECNRLKGLASIFEFPQLVEPVSAVSGR